MSMSLSDLKQLAYVHNGRDLYEVTADPRNGEVELENCKTLYRHDEKVPDVIDGFWLVHAAPREAPDQPPEEEAS